MWALAVATTPAPSHNTSPLTQVLVLVIAALVVALVTGIVSYVLRKNREMYRRNLAIANDVHEIKVVLTGRPPTDLDRSPPAGLVEVVAGHTKTLATLLRASATLIADTKPNDGSSTKDTLNVIVAEQDRVASELKRKEEE